VSGSGLGSVPGSSTGIEAAAAAGFRFPTTGETPTAAYSSVYRLLSLDSAPSQARDTSVTLSFTALELSCFLSFSEASRRDFEGPSTPLRLPFCARHSCVRSLVAERLSSSLNSRLENRIFKSEPFLWRGFREHVPVLVSSSRYSCHSGTDTPNKRDNSSSE
jgi:hypothetical protein